MQNQSLHSRGLISLGDNAISIILAAGIREAHAAESLHAGVSARGDNDGDEGLLAHRIIHASSTNSLKPPTAPRNWNPD